MMKRFGLLALAFLCFGTPVAAIELADVLSALQSPFVEAPAATRISTFTAEFFQLSHLASLDRSQEGEGSVTVHFLDKSAPGASRVQFRWQYREPTPQDIVSDATTLWVYVPENNQVIRSAIDVNSERPDDPMTFLNSLGHLEQEFFVTWGEPQQDEEGNYLLKLTPRRQSPVLQGMLVQVDAKAVKAVLDKKPVKIFPICSTTVLDPGGNSTFIAFREVQINPSIAPGIFAFRVPEGVSVVEPGDAGLGL